jgi:integrative and conjugative element protein (TIGR02256 family)
VYASLRRMPTVGDLCFWSLDDRFGLVLPARQLTRILRWRGRASPDETGGTLIGHFTKARDCALVTEVTGPPLDSRRGRTWFERGTGELQALLDRRWRRRRQHYLGEWHIHPGASEPSSLDISQMKSIARSHVCARPEPLLVLVGEDSGGEWTVNAYVFPRGQRHVELARRA